MTRKRHFPFRCSRGCAGPAQRISLAGERFLQWAKLVNYFATAILDDVLYCIVSVGQCSHHITNRNVWFCFCHFFENSNVCLRLVLDHVLNSKIALQVLCVVPRHAPLVSRKDAFDGHLEKKTVFVFVLGNNRNVDSCAHTRSRAKRFQRRRYAINSNTSFGTVSTVAW
jgi:hypothetical protein